MGLLMFFVAAVILQLPRQLLAAVAVVVAHAVMQRPLTRADVHWITMVACHCAVVPEKATAVTKTGNRSDVDDLQGG